MSSERRIEKLIATDEELALLRADLAPEPAQG